MLQLVKDILDIDLAGHDFRYTNTIKYSINSMNYNSNYHRGYKCNRCKLNLQINICYNIYKNIHKIKYLSISCGKSGEMFFINKEINVNTHNITWYDGPISSCNQIMMKKACE